MKRTLLLLMILSFCFSSFVFSQESSTAIEKALLSKGITLIKIFKDMATMHTLYSGELTITAIVVEDYETSDKHKGVRLTYCTNWQCGNTSSVFLDLDESIQAIKVIANMREIYDSVVASKTGYCEVSFNSNGGLVTTIRPERQELCIAMKIGGYEVFLSIERISDIVMNLERAVNWLKSK